MILPAAVRYQTELALERRQPARRPASRPTRTIARRGLGADRGAPGRPRDARAPRSPPTTGETALAEAEYAGDALLPAMAAVRAAADVLEGVVADDLWPLPTYQEMLYIL